MTQDAITELNSGDRAGWMRNIEVAVRRTMAKWTKARVGVNGGSLRVGSGTGLAALDGTDGSIIASGGNAALYFGRRDAPSGGDYAGWYYPSLNVIRLYSSALGADVWTVDALSGILTQPAWTPPTLLNSWANHGSLGPAAGYRKNLFGEVELRGVITGGTATSGTILLNLPAGSRPTGNDRPFPVVSNDSAGEVRITSGGDVKILVGSSTWLSLNGIVFDTA